MKQRDEILRDNNQEVTKQQELLEKVFKGSFKKTCKKIMTFSLLLSSSANYSIFDEIEGGY